MMPSESDRHAWLELLISIGVLFAITLLFGAGPWMLSNLAPRLSNFLGLVAAIFGLINFVHILLILPTALTHKLLARVTGVDVAKFYRSFCHLIGRQLILKFLNSRGCGIEPDVILKGRKMYQIAIKSKGRYPVIDGFFGIRRGFSDRCPELFQNHFNVFWKTCNKFIYIFGGCLSDFHDTSL
jgi:hypothetical protein